MPSVKHTLLVEILKELRESSFPQEPGDSVGPINKADIVFRKVSVADREENKGKKNEGVPGLIVSTPKTTDQVVEGGENARDEWHHKFLIQIISGDIDPEENIATYWAWQEKIVDLFNFQRLAGVIQHPVGCISTVIVRYCDDVDEKYWVKHQKFVAGVEVTAIVFKDRE